MTEKSRSCNCFTCWLFTLNFRVLEYSEVRANTYRYQDPNTHIHHESAIDLHGACCEVARDYGKRPYVFRLKLSDGSEYLFQAKNAVSLSVVTTYSFLFSHVDPRVTCGSLSWYVQSADRLSRHINMHPSCMVKEKKIVVVKHYVSVVTTYSFLFSHVDPRVTCGSLSWYVQSADRLSRHINMHPSCMVKEKKIVVVKHYVSACHNYRHDYPLPLDGSFHCSTSHSTSLW